MAREIKFRAWNVEARKMVDLADITPLALDAGMNTQLAMQGASGLFIPFIRGMKIMQFTGLKDKNGVEIYEGDILRLDEESLRLLGVEGHPDIVRSNCRVGMRDGCWMFARSVVTDELDTYLWMWTGGVEVIGNIHRNAELLEAQ